MMQIDPAGLTRGLQSGVSTAKDKAELDKLQKDFTSHLAKATENVADSKETARLKSVCRDMEAVFLNLMWKGMRDTVPKANLMSGGFGEDIMRSMQDTELTKQMAKSGGMGLADMIYRQLSMTTDNTRKNQASK